MIRGRPPIEIDMVRAMALLADYSGRKVARMMGIHHNTLYYHINHIEQIPLWDRIEQDRAFAKHQGFVRRVARCASRAYLRQRAALREVPRVIKIHLPIVPSDGHLRCNKCLSLKPLTGFYFKKEQETYRHTCIACCRKRSREVWHMKGRFNRVRIPRPRITPLSEVYPYMLSGGADGAGLLASINNMVPRNLPDVLRADVCQALALAVISGEVEMENIAAHIKRFIKEQSGFMPNRWEVSLDSPVGEGHRYRLIDHISEEEYADCWAVNKNYYGGALSDCESAEDYAERLRGAWEANRLTESPRRTYSRFSRKHEEDNRRVVSSAQVSGRIGMSSKVRRTYRPSPPPRIGVERKLDELAYWKYEYIDTRAAEERQES